MKLTPRDKKLLLILGAFIFLVVYVKFLMIPKISNINELNSQIATLNNTYSMNLTYKQKLNNMDSDIKIISKKLTDLRAIYPPSVNCDELLVLIQDLAGKSKLNIDKIIFQQIQPANINTPESPNQAAQNGQADQATASALNINQSGSSIETKIANYFNILGLLPNQNSQQQSIIIPDGKGYYVSVSIEASGTNEQIKSFYSALNKLKNRAICKNATLKSTGATDSGEQQLDLTTTIDFYGIMDKGAGEYYLLPNGKWFPTAASDKKNLFKPYEGANTSRIQVTSENAIGSNATEQDELPSNLDGYDFSISTAAFGGGFIPSVSVCCNNPASTANDPNPVAYGDNKEIENVEISVEQIAGRFYCKFKTAHEAYPDAKYTETMQFIPRGKNLKLFIISSVRSGKDDKAGVNISIINNTNTRFTYKIYNDDKTNPRVKIGKTVGDVKNE